MRFDSSQTQMDMTAQELLILSFFDRDIPRQMNDSDLTAKMIAAKIGSNASADFMYPDLVHQLKSKGLLVFYKDPTKVQKGIVRAAGPELLVLSDKAVEILNSDKHRKVHEANVSELELENLKKQNALLAQQLADYGRTKKQAFWAIIISVVSAIAAIISLIIKK